MITFLSSPKPFKGKDKENQYRAIRNWLTACESVEVILYGDSEGILDAGNDLNVKVIKNIETSSFGVPYFGAIVNHAAIYGKYDTQIYLNCDILLSGICEASKALNFRNFLFIGQRIDLSDGIIIEEPSSIFKKVVRQLFEEKKIRMHESTGVDYFMFKRNMWKGLQPIIIGRGGYDNALLAFCKENKIPIIDGTPSVIALHQFHDYKHISGNSKLVFGGKDAKHNLKVAGKYSLLSISDSDYILDDFHLIYKPCHGDKLRRLELYIRFVWKMRYTSMSIRLIWRILNLLKIIRKEEYSIDKFIESNHSIYSNNL
jgi:hypothetical protein